MQRFQQYIATNGFSASLLLTKGAGQPPPTFPTEPLTVIIRMAMDPGVHNMAIVVVAGSVARPRSAACRTARKGQREQAHRRRKHSHRSTALAEGTVIKLITILSREYKHLSGVQQHAAWGPGSETAKSRVGRVRSRRSVPGDVVVSRVRRRTGLSVATPRLLERILRSRLLPALVFLPL